MVLPKNINLIIGPAGSGKTTQIRRWATSPYFYIGYSPLKESSNNKIFLDKEVNELPVFYRDTVNAQIILPPTEPVEKYKGLIDFYKVENRIIFIDEFKLLELVKDYSSLFESNNKIVLSLHTLESLRKFDQNLFSTILAKEKNVFVLGGRENLLPKDQKTLSQLKENEVVELKAYKPQKRSFFSRLLFSN